MAEPQAPVRPHAPAKPGGNPLTRKLGPLPMYAWVVVLVGAYFLYKHFAGTFSGTTPASTATDQTYVPPFDSAAGSASGGIGLPLTPSGDTTNNYYYGSPTTTAAQAAGGGTATAPIKSGTTPTRQTESLNAGGTTFQSTLPLQQEASSGSLLVKAASSGATKYVPAVPGGVGSVKVPGGKLTQ